MHRLGLALLTLLVAGCSRCGQPAAVPVPLLAPAAVLATLPEEKARPAEPETGGLGLHGGLAPGERQFFFGERGGGVAWVEEADGGVQVVHSGRAGTVYEAVGALALSPSGARLAYGALIDGGWHMVREGVEGRPFAAVQAPVFSPDGKHLAYQAMQGERWYLVVDEVVSEGTATRYLSHEFSADSKRLAYIDDVDETEHGRLVVANLALSERTVVEPKARGLLVSADRTAFAAIAMERLSAHVTTGTFEHPEAARRGRTYDAVSDLAFGQSDDALAYVAMVGQQRAMVRCSGLQESSEPFSQGELYGPPVPRPNSQTVGALVMAEGGVRLHEFFAGGQGDGRPYEEAVGLVYSADGRAHAYAARRGGQWLLVVSGKEGPAFDRVVTPVFSPNGQAVAYRARQAGQRFVVVADGAGATLRQHPLYEQVFPVHFTADGRAIAYGVKAGPQLRWVVEPL